MADATLAFVYNYVRDLAAVRRFYTELVGLPEKAYDERYGYLCYKTGALEFMFFRAEGDVPPPPGGGEWALQPGYDGGRAAVTSWSILVAAEAYAATVARLKAANVPRWRDAPDWRVDSYWGFTVRDPAGNTVEVYVIPAAKPASTAWPAE